MNSYPHDEFDDVSEVSPSRGAYRGKKTKPNASRRSFYALIGVGILGLLLGAVTFVVQPRTLAPDANENISAAISASPSEIPSGSPTDSGIKDPSSINVHIYNGGAYAGAAASVKEELTQAGYKVTQTSNWEGEPLPYSMIYYSNGFIQEANTVADGLGFTYFEEKSNLDSDISVVLGPDFAGIVPGNFQENIDAAQATASATPSKTPAN